MRRTFFFVLPLGAIYALLAIPLTAAPPQTQTAPTTRPEAIDALLSALHDGNFKQAFALCKVYQAEIERFHASNPHVLWDKLDADYFDAQEKLYRARGIPLTFNEAAFGKAQAPREIVELAKLLEVNETHQVQEKRVDNVHGKEVTVNFVSIKYADEVAPWIDGKLLKETMVKVTTEIPSNLFLSVSHIKEADIFRDSTSLRIYAVGEKQEALTLDPLHMHGGDTFKTSLGIHVVGGKPPYQALIRTPGYQASLTKDAAGDVALLHDLGQSTNPKYQYDGFLDDCLVSVTDGNGDTDVVRFSCHGAKFGSFGHWFVRKSWLRMGEQLGRFGPVDWQYATSFTTDDPQAIVKHFDELDTLKKLEVASHKRTMVSKGVYMYQLIAYPGLWSDSYGISQTNQFTRWRMAHDVILRTGDIDYPKGSVSLKGGNRVAFKPVGDAPVAVTVIMYNRKPTAQEKTADLPLLPEPATDSAK